MTVSLNDKPLGGGTMKDDWLELDVAPKSLKQHENRVEMRLAEKAEANSTVRDLIVIVQYDN